MVSTSDFGSENIGSSPVPPTLSYLNNIMFITKSVTTLACESRGILFFIQDDNDRRKRNNFKATESQDRQQSRACYRQYGRGSARGIENDFGGTTTNDKGG